MREAVLVAILCQRDAGDQFHREIGLAAVGDAGVVDFGHARVVHQRKRLPFRGKAGDHLPAVHPQPDDFQGHLAAHRLKLLGFENLAHASFAQQRNDPVRPDPMGRLSR